MFGVCFEMSEHEEVLRHGPDQYSAEDMDESKNGSISGSSDQNLRKQVEDKKLAEVNRQIGYYVKKRSQFIPMTNFSVTCIGYMYVTDNSQYNSSEGFLFNVAPKTAFVQGDDDDQLQKRLVKATLYKW